MQSDTIYTRIPATALYPGGWEWGLEGFANWPKFLSRPKSDQIAWAEQFWGMGIKEPVDVFVASDGWIHFQDGHHRVMAGKLLGRDVPVRIDLRKIRQRHISEFLPDLLVLLKEGYSPRDYNPQRWSLKHSGVPPLNVVKMGREAADHWIMLQSEK